ncbi:hypothetical protein IQ255_05800 [Pleurocapsales cyanobacterium LEGE 10410]|nr:hypothetical protein [Pleurocapsales cyanobacterium LEGE 10410]
MSFYVLVQDVSCPKRIIPPLRYKMATITLLALFPLIQLVSAIFTPLLELFPLPELLQSLILTAITVLLMTYAAMPRMTKLFAWWLYPKNSSSKQVKRSPR